MLTLFNFCSVGEDFEAPFSSTVILFQEDAVEEVLIPITDDQLFEGATDETFNVRISLPSCPAPGMLTIENAESIVSIEDNDVRPGMFMYIHTDFLQKHIVITHCRQFCCYLLTIIIV